MSAFVIILFIVVGLFILANRSDRIRTGKTKRRWYDIGL